MSQWTPAARQELEAYLARVKSATASAGGDPGEVAEDLKRHIEAEVAGAQLPLVTDEDVRRITLRLGVPAGETLPPRAGDSVTSTGQPVLPPESRGGPGYVLFTFGVLLPLITLGLEAITAMCAGTFFDPVPSLWHGLLVALVPVANGLAWSACRRGRREWRGWLGWLNGLAIGVTFFYTLVFLPLMVPGLFAVIFFGFGLLPLSPLLALIAAGNLRKHIKRLGASEQPIPLAGLWRGALLGWTLLALADAPVWLTRVGLNLATSPEPEQRERGVSMLRQFGHNETLLRLCYGRTQMAENMDLIGWIVSGNKTVYPEQARELYYRVTGKAFNSVPPPNVRTARGRWAGLDDFTWDEDQGGTSVGGRVKGLTLKSSRMDGIAEGTSATGYLEWILEFQNASAMDREARAQILLPPGGVVSRLTLWVNSEEREAAFAGKEVVREAYQQVAIRQRRDPVLVTTSGPDRVLMQCFPVPRNGGAMKVRLGISLPLECRDGTNGLFRCPTFVERNFSVPDTFRHELWVESAQALASGLQGLRLDDPRPGTHSLRGKLTEWEMSESAGLVKVALSAGTGPTWARDERSTPPGFVVQNLVPETVTPPARLAVVVDGSESMRPYLGQVADALRQVPDQLPFDLFVASDQVLELTRNVDRQVALMELRRHQAQGGQDSLPTLLEAWDRAALSTNGIVLWLHTAQPVLLENTDALRLRYQRRSHGPRIVELQVGSGPNRLLERMEGVTQMESLRVTEGLGKDLAHWVRRQTGLAHNLAPVREHMDTLPAGLQGTKESSSHQVRLWAFDQIKADARELRLGQAAKLGGLYQLVTPASGAVVLETKEQFERFGLTPSDPTSVPSIPEPATWLLLGLGLAVLATMGRRRVAGRRAAGR